MFTSPIGFFNSQTGASQEVLTLLLNGSDQYVAINNSTSVGVYNEGTISMWVNLDGLTSSSGTYQVFFSKYENGIDRSWALRLMESGNALQFALYDDTNTEILATYDESGMVTDQWYHIAATWSDTDIKLYLDGNLVASETKDNQINKTTAEIRIGGQGDTILEYPTFGAVALPILFYEQLTDSEVLELATAKQPYAYDTTSMYFGIPLNKGVDVGEEESDVIGNRNGTLSTFGSDLPTYTGELLPLEGAPVVTPSGYTTLYLNSGGDSDAQYGNVAYDSSLDFTTGMALSIWCYKDSTADLDMVLFDKRTSTVSDDGYVLYYNSTTNAFQGSASIGGSVVTAYGTTSVQDETWYNIILTYNGSYLNLYVNGTHEGRAAASGNIATNSSYLRIGGSVGTVAGSLWEGSLAIALAYSDTLDSTAIEELQDAADPSLYTQDNMVMGLPLNMGSFTPAVDTTGTGNDISLTNSPDFDGAELPIQIGDLEEYTAASLLLADTQYLNYGTDAAFDIEADGESLIEVWFKFAAADIGTSPQPIVGKTDGSTGFAITIRENSGNYNVEFYANGSAGSNNIINDLSADTWHQIIVNNTATSSRDFWVDGSQTNQGTSTTLSEYTGDFKVGGWDTDATTYQGEVGFVALYNREFKDEEIPDLYNNGNPIQYVTLPCWYMEYCTFSVELNADNPAYADSVQGLVPDAVNDPESTGTDMTYDIDPTYLTGDYQMGHWDGEVGTSVVWDANADYFASTTGFTVSGWFRIDPDAQSGVSTSYYIWKYHNVTANAWNPHFYVSSNGTARIGINGSVASDNSQDWRVGLHHFAITFDSSDTNTYTLYLDGSQRDTGSGFQLTSYATPQPCIGENLTTGDTQAAYISNVIYQTKVATSSDITQIYNSGNIPYYESIPANLVEDVQWACELSSRDTSISDISGNSRTNVVNGLIGFDDTNCNVSWSEYVESYDNEWIYVGSQSSSYTAALAIHRVTDEILVMGTGNSTDDGQIFRSTNAGKSWTQVTSLTGINQWGHFTTIESTGRILVGAGPVGRQGAEQQTFTIYYSDDQGLTWSDLGASRDGSDLAAISDIIEIEDGILLLGGYLNGVWKSTDGGLNWVNKYDSGSRISSNFNILSDGTYLFMMTGGSAGDAWLVSSSDQGESWSALYQFDNQNYQAMKVLNDDVIIVCATDDGGVFRSTDLGTSFTEIYNFSDMDEITYLEYDPLSETLYACGNDSADSNGYVYQSTDQGDTWEFCESSSFRYMNGMTIISDSKRALSCGGESTVAVWTNKEYEDYDSNWFVTEDFGYAQTLSIDRSDSGTILCSYGSAGVSSSAHIARSTNSGETWTDVGYSTSADQIQSISYVGNNEGNETWIATLGQGWTQVIQSTDDGLTWSTAYTASSRTYKTFSIGDGICFAGGRDFGDYIWRSTDYGANFTQVKGDSGANNIEDFVQTSNGDIYAVSSYGSGRAKLYKSTDSGETWSLIYTTTGGEEYLSITAISDTKLLMGTDVEQIYESTDSGVTWSLLSTTPNASDDIFSLEYDSDNDKLLMGSGDTSQLNNGAIYSSDDQGATWTLEQSASDQCTDILLIPSELRVLACQGRGSSESWIWTNKAYS